MTKITHEKAHTLIQAVVDQLLLRTEEKTALDAHLDECIDCKEYANELTMLETNLQRALHASWDEQQPNMNLQAILHPSPGKQLLNSFFNQTSFMAKATIVTALLLGYFVITNLLGIQSPISGDKTATILPTPNEAASIYATSPTPSAQLSSTRSTQTCKTVTYLVREDDTLASIAFQHGISQESILVQNHLVSDTVFTGMELSIPLCNSTPSHTATIPTNMLTTTPVDGAIFSTQTQ